MFTTTVKMERIIPPPSEPKNWTMELEAPISLGSTEYCAESVVVAMVMPTPNPIGINPNANPPTGNIHMKDHRGVNCEIFRRGMKPKAISVMPTRQIFLYEILGRNIPPTMDPTTIGTTKK